MYFYLITNFFKINISEIERIKKPEIDHEKLNIKTNKIITKISIIYISC